jgi:hypothetical protein
MMFKRAEQMEELGARSGLYGGCSRTSHCYSCMTTRVPIMPTRQMRCCEISSGKSSRILRIAPTLLRAMREWSMHPVSNPKPRRERL